MMNDEIRSTELNGWTNIGDKYTASGKWVIYKKGGSFGSLAWIVKDFPVDERDKAINTFDKAAEILKKGGLWLVGPDGTVAKRAFKIINRF